MMEDEIKQILDKLKDGNWYEELDLTGTMWIELRFEETHLLLDYITNLQEENNRLNNIITELNELIDSYELGKYDYSVPVFILKDKLKELEIQKNDKFQGM